MQVIEFGVVFFHLREITRSVHSELGFHSYMLLKNTAVDAQICGISVDSVKKFCLWLFSESSLGF